MTYILQDKKDGAYYGLFSNLFDLNQYVKRERDFNDRFSNFTVLREDSLGHKTTVYENGYWTLTEGDK